MDSKRILKIRTLLEFSERLKQKEIKKSHKKVYLDPEAESVSFFTFDFARKKERQKNTSHEVK